MTALLVLNGRRAATQKTNPTSPSRSKFKRRATDRRGEGLYVCRLHALPLFLELWPACCLADVSKADISPVWRMRKSDRAACPGSPLLSGRGRSRSQISPLSPAEPVYRPRSTREPRTLGFASTRRGHFRARQGCSEHCFPAVAPGVRSDRNAHRGSAASGHAALKGMLAF